jgi:hypothetical protein
LRARQKYLRNDTKGLRSESESLLKAAVNVVPLRAGREKYVRNFYELPALLFNNFTVEQEG